MFIELECPQCGYIMYKKEYYCFCPNPFCKNKDVKYEKPTIELKKYES